MKLKLYFLTIVGILFFSVISSKAQVESSTFDLIRQRIYDAQVASAGDITSIASNVTGYLSTLDVPTGKWSDITYTETVRTNPSWSDALSRLKEMALAYTVPGNIYYQSSSLYSAINNALNYFCTLSPVPYSTNWYYQGVTRPQALALILIYMNYGQQSLDATVKQTAINVLCKDTAVTDGDRNNPLNSTNVGSNKAIVAMDWIYISTIINSDYMLKIGAQESFVPIKYVTGDGIRYDLSYADHTDYLYTGSYGTELMNSITNVAYYLRGTDYALQGTQLALFRKWIVETQIPTIRGQYVDWNIIGRAISRTGTLKRDHSGLMSKLQAIDPDSAALYESARMRMNGSQSASYDVQDRNRVYFSTDYTLHNRAGYNIGIHNYSSRTKSNEIGNSENLLGFYLADGATNIQITGDEYYNLFPLWNWTYIPGTTVPDSLLSSTTANNSEERYGTSSFAGGVSDSLYGASTMVMDNEVGTTSAKKGWFLFDNEVVCLGAGINSSSLTNINTTVNQTLMRSSTLPASVNGTTTNVGIGVNQTYDNTLDWIVNDGVGYAFPNAGKLNLVTENRSSNWLGITGAGADNSNNVQSANVFQLSFSHGVRPQDDKYAYIIVPNINSASEMSAYNTANNISIGVNSDSVQAVFNKSLDMWQFIYYKSAAKYSNDSMKIWTSVPCAVILKKKGDGKYLIHVADPAHLYSNVTVFAKLPGFSDVKYVNIQLPTGNYKGQSAAAVITDDSDDYIIADEDGANTVTVLRPIGDSYINGRASMTNYGQDPSILVKYDGASSSYNRFGFLKFDLGSIDTVANGPVTSVRVKMYIKSVNTTATFSTYAWSLWHVPDYCVTWSEGTGVTASSYEDGITWSNFSSIAYKILDTSDYNIASSGTVPFAAGTEVSWESSTNQQLVKSLRNELTSSGNKLFSLFVNGSTANTKSDVYFYSKDQTSSSDTAYVPVLEIIQTKTESTTPVSLSPLSAEYDKSAKSSSLHWYTYTEKNVSRFVVLHSIDGKSYTSIGEVAAAGNSESKNSYQYIDANPTSGVHFYQIKAVDLDGSYTLSNMISVNVSAVNSVALIVMPNPAKSYTIVSSPVSGTGKLIDISGKVMKTFAAVADQTVTLDISGMSAGVYFISVENSTNKLIKKIIIAK